MHASECSLGVACRRDPACQWLRARGKKSEDGGILPYSQAAYRKKQARSPALSRKTVLRRINETSTNYAGLNLPRGAAGMSAGRGCHRNDRDEEERDESYFLAAAGGARRVVAGALLGRV